MLVWFKAYLTTLMQPYQLKMDILYLLIKMQSCKCSSIQVRQSIPRVPRNMLSTVKVSSVPTMISSDKSNLECLKNTASKSALLGSGPKRMILTSSKRWLKTHPHRTAMLARDTFPMNIWVMRYLLIELLRGQLTNVLSAKKIDSYLGKVSEEKRAGGALNYHLFVKPR